MNLLCQSSNDGTVFVPPYPSRLAATVLERVKDVFAETAPPQLSVPQE